MLQNDKISHYFPVLNIKLLNKDITIICTDCMLNLILNDHIIINCCVFLYFLYFLRNYFSLMIVNLHLQLDNIINSINASFTILIFTIKNNYLTTIKNHY